MVCKNRHHMLVVDCSKLVKYTCGVRHALHHVLFNLPIRKNIVKNTKASSTSSSVSRIELCTYVTCALSPHPLQSSNDPISSSLCNDNCAHLISKHTRGRNWHRVSRIKPFIIPDRRAFLSPFIRFVIFRRRLLG